MRKNKHLPGSAIIYMSGNLCICWHIFASTLSKNCQACLNSIQEGINFLKEDDKALKAFKLTNEAILFQQLRGSIKKKSLEEMNN